MGFPTWTLWGMGITAFLALLWIGLAYLALSPRWLLRLGLSGYRLDLRLRLFVGYGFACLLLALGFFLAGVPLGGETAVSPPQANEQPTAAVVAAFGNDPVATPFPTITTIPPTATTGAALPAANEGAGTASEPSTGAFGLNPTATLTATAIITPTATPVATLAAAVATDGPTPTLTPTATSTATATPTTTPTPTVTATPIVGETAVVNTGSSTVWVRRTPGGQNLVLVKGGDVVILQPGLANRASTFWQEIRTVDGVVGWLEQAYLDRGE